MLPRWKTEPIVLPEADFTDIQDATGVEIGAHL